MRGLPWLGTDQGDALSPRDIDAELAAVVAQARELAALLAALEPEQLDADDWADLRERAHALADFRARLFTLLERLPSRVGLRR